MTHPKNLIKTYTTNELFSLITDENIQSSTTDTYIHIHNIIPAPFDIKRNTIKYETKKGIYTDTILVILDASEFNIWKKLCNDCMTYISNMSDIIKKTEVLDNIIIVKHSRINNKKDILPNLFTNHFKSIIWKRVILNTSKISKFNQFKSKETYILDTSYDRIHRKTNIYTEFVKYCSKKH